jgi:polysaccharide chain length determinant protein (PEP-CTERM system associated)
MLPGKRYTPEDVQRIVWRRKWLLIVPTVLAAIVTAVALRYVPSQYRSETLILVVPQRVPESYVQSTVTSRIEDRLQSISQQILSRTRLERIITDFDLYKDERASMAMEDVVLLMRGSHVRVDIVRGDAFRISYVAENPVIAQQITERLASYFIEENLRDREVLAEATNQFLDTQLQDARARLIEQEKKLEGYRMKHGGELPTQAQSNLTALQNLQFRAQSLQESIARDRDRRLVLERSLADAEEALSEASVATRRGNASGMAQQGDGVSITGNSATEQLAQARRMLEALEMRLKPEHPDVGRVKRLIADLEPKAELERTEATELTSGDPEKTRRRLSGPARRMADLQEEISLVNRDIKNREEQLAEVQRSAASYQNRLEAMPVRESELTELMRDYSTLGGVYTSLLSKREASKVAANLERRQIGEQFKVIDPARRPERPFSPNRPRLTAMGAAAGLGIGAALILLLEYRDRAFHSEYDVMTALGLPVLAVVPRLYGAHERKRRRRWRLSGIGTALVLVVIAAVVYVQFLR